MLPGRLSDADLGARIEALVAGYVADPARLRLDRQKARARFEAEYTQARFEQRWLEVLAMPPATGRTSATARSSLVAASAAVRAPLPSALKSPLFEASRVLHARFLKRPLPDRIAVYFHALDSADQAALIRCVSTLRGLGYRTVSFDDYVDPATRGKVCNVSFDDNYRSWHRSLPLLADLDLGYVFHQYAAVSRHL